MEHVKSQVTVSFTTINNKFQPTYHNINSKVTWLIETSMIMVIVCQLIATYQSIVLTLQYHLNMSHSGIISINNDNLNSYGTVFGEIYLDQIIHANTVLLIPIVSIGLILLNLCNIYVLNSTISSKRHDTEHTDKFAPIAYIVTNVFN